MPLNRFTSFLARTLAALCLLILPLPLLAQTNVGVMLVPIAQYFNTNGQVLASGCVFTFAAGTNTNQATYSDSLGVTQLPNPILLNGSGYPTNASGGVTTVFVTNQSYKFVLKTAGGVNCATGSQIYSADNVQGFLGVLNLANTWAQQQTFSLPIVVTPTSLQFVIGAPGQQTTLNFPQPLANITLNMPSIADTLLGKLSACSPHVAGQYLRDNGTQIACTAISQSDVTISIPNNGVFGTLLNSLAKISGATGTVQFTNITDTGGVIGIVTAGNGLSGSATIQSTGLVNCAFDGSTTAGDYVQISTTQTGGCHDTGSTYPLIGQVVGRVLSTNVGVGTYQIYLFGPEIKPTAAGYKVECINTTPVTVTNTATETILMSCVIPANELGNNQTLRIHASGLNVTAATQTLTMRVRIGGVAGTVLGVSDVAIANSSGGSWNLNFTVTANGAPSGSTATECQGMFIENNGTTTPLGTTMSNGATVAWATNTSLTLVITQAWSAAVVATFIERELIVERLN